MRRSLHCWLGWHAPGQQLAVRHRVYLANGRCGSLVLARCRRCGRRYQTWMDRYLWKLDTVQRR